MILQCLEDQRGSIPEAEYSWLKQQIAVQGQFRDKIRGCMFGGAVGDALGWPIEFKTEREIRNRFWPDGIKEYKLNKSGVAEITDDTQMSLFTANGILYGETMERLRGISRRPRKHVAIAYQDWLDTQQPGWRPGGISWLSYVRELWEKRAPGRTCLYALQEQNENPGMIEDYVIAEINDSKGCGSIMRVAPMGLRNWKDIRALDYEGAQLGAITHGHPLGYMPCAVLVHIINRIVFPPKPDCALKDIIIEARDTVSEVFAGNPFLPKLCGIIDRAVDLAEHSHESDLDNIHMLGEGWLADDALAISLYCALRYQDDFSGGIIAAVNHKGDSDSTGAVTGNILGTWVGYDAIEEKWKQNLELSDVVLEIADDLCYGCLVTEGGKYKDSEWMRKYVDVRRKD